MIKYYVTWRVKLGDSTLIHTLGQVRLLLLLLTLYKGPGKELSCIGMSQARSALLCARVRGWGVVLNEALLHKPTSGQSMQVQSTQAVLAGNHTRSWSCAHFTSPSTAHKLQSSCEKKSPATANSFRQGSHLRLILMNNKEFSSWCSCIPSKQLFLISCAPGA